MATLLTRYRERLQHQHGWEVELRCPACAASALPSLDGWTPSYAVNFGDAPTIYANVTCSKCGVDLKDAAGKKLVEIFAGVPVPPRNNWLLVWFLVFAVGTPLLLTAGLYLGVLAGWWGYRGFVGLSFLPVLLWPVLMWFNWQVASIRFQCACGNPAYKFMGLLGRSYCYRCSSCGKLLRLRD